MLSQRVSYTSSAASDNRRHRVIGPIHGKGNALPLLETNSHIVYYGITSVCGRWKLCATVVYPVHTMSTGHIVPVIHICTSSNKKSHLRNQPNFDKMILYRKITVHPKPYKFHLNLHKQRKRQQKEQH